VKTDVEVSECAAGTISIGTNDGMNRRELLQHALLVSPIAQEYPSHLDVPVLCLTNKHARCSASQMSRFYSDVWNEAVRSFTQCGVTLRVIEREGEILKYPSGRPRFVGLERGRVNVVLTDYVPLHWDNGRFEAGVATIYEGYHLCIISVNLAYGNSVPFLAVNTVVHELLHIFLQDILSSRRGLLQAHSRETHVDWHATRMWLFKDDATVREAAREYLTRLWNK